MIKVINNFLPTIFFKKLNTIINDSNFQWYFNESNLKPNQPGYKKGKYYFTHNIYDENIGKMSEVFNVFEPILYFIDQIKICDDFKINYKIISILKRRESEIVCKLLYKYSLNKELEIAKYAIFSLGSIWNDNSFEQLSKLENEIKDPSLLKCIKNQKLISNQFLINK